MHKVRRILERARSGQGLVEMALALPVLLLMFLAMVELGLLLRAHLVVINADREAARFASRGTFTDDAIAARAMTSFAGQIPAELDGPDANTQIIITRLHIPARDAESDYTWKPQYITGTLGLPSQIDPEVEGRRFGRESDEFNDDLVGSQPDAVRTSQDVVFVEIYYHHYEALHAPIIEWVFPDPMVVYWRTVMRVGQSRVW
jgi:hypothetical protein